MPEKRTYVQSIYFPHIYFCKPALKSWVCIQPVNLFGCYAEVSGHTEDHLLQGHLISRPSLYWRDGVPALQETWWWFFDVAVAGGLRFSM